MSDATEPLRWGGLFGCENHLPGTHVTIEEAEACIQTDPLTAQGAAPIHVCPRQVLGTRCITCEQYEGAAHRAEGLTLEAVKRAIRYVTDNEPYDLSLVKECARLANDVAARLSPHNREADHE